MRHHVTVTNAPAITWKAAMATWIRSPARHPPPQVLTPGAAADIHGHPGGGSGPRVFIRIDASQAPDLIRKKLVRNDPRALAAGIVTGLLRYNDAVFRSPVRRASYSRIRRKVRYLYAEIEFLDRRDYIQVARRQLLHFPKIGYHALLLPICRTSSSRTFMKVDLF